MQGSKIRLSVAESELFGNAQIILTKNSVLQKTVSLLGNVQEALVAEAPAFIKAASPSPKISRGENYLSLPYVILDYPRIAKGGDLLFIRSMFWWGRFFSSTLLIAGTHKQKHLPQLENAYRSLSDNDYFMGINADPWIHHFEEDNYRKVSTLSKEAFAAVMEVGQHAKIATRWPLEEWDSAEQKLVESWRLLAAILKSNDG